MMRFLAVLVLLFSGTAAQAAAWALPAGHWQMFTSATTSQASRSFDAAGRSSVPTTFDKQLIQNTLEFGLTNYLTIFAIPAYVTARVQTPTVPLTQASDTSFEGGARIALLAFNGKLSLQGSYKAAGAFDFSVSHRRDPGHQAELRLLYGTGFRLFERDGFLDIEVAQRWIDRPRPNETPIDITVGLWLNRSNMMMLQSFNVISAGDAIPPYSYYRAHKLQLSIVQRLTRHWSLQTGVFFSPAGQNALVERGITVSLWTQT